MARTRIILETSNQRKSAMAEAADLQGASLTDWVEEQVGVIIPRLSGLLNTDLPEIKGPDELQDPIEIFNSLANQDWSFTNDDTRYLTHDLHPYPAKFIPQIPSNLIVSLSMRGDIVCDPFGGSATTAVEAVRLGRRSVSIDANPLSELIGRVKTGFMASSERASIDQLIAAVEGHIISLDSEKSDWSDTLAVRYQKYVPEIPNIEKWFNRHATGELALLRHLIHETTEGLARDAAFLTLSRVIIRISNQESETRYVSVPKNITRAFTLRAYLETLKTVIRRIETAAIDLQFADARFLTVDSREDLSSVIGENSVDLIVTSPPYPNATDYHLYHRFRLFWLGFDPKELGHIEIGSHLRHQRNNTGFEEYRNDMTEALKGCIKILQPGRYAVFVVGDALFKGEKFSTCDAICESARLVGFSVLGTIERPIHLTKRSFAKPGRRARSEQLVVLQKPNQAVKVSLNPPAYRMWQYEEALRSREIEALTSSVSLPIGSGPVSLMVKQPALWHIRRLTFTKDYYLGDAIENTQPTWQKILENGDANPAKRKDPKYVTHGLHPFKGKFYPQLAKSLLNISGVAVNSRLLDPFCGSGTTLLESMLNGFNAYGCDFNPLAAKISRAKTVILTVPRDITDLSMRAILDRLPHQQGPFPQSLDQFHDDTHKELMSWFSEPVLFKLNWILGQIRLFGNAILVDFFEVILSSLIREVSHQDPTDLRIRRRKQPLQDAPVIELFHERLTQQHSRLRKYWSVAGRQPGLLITPTVIQGDSRKADTMQALGLDTNSVDCVITSPPYATALPYIDTDRLSLLSIMSLPSQVRSDLEENLTGSREIRRPARKKAEAALLDDSATNLLPGSLVDSIRYINNLNTTYEVGFRRANMSALLWRYFSDMRQNLDQVYRVMKPGAKAFYVVGDSKTKAGEAWLAIETCKHIANIGIMVGLDFVESIKIDVTTENFKHINNAITENKVLIFQKP